MVLSDYGKLIALLAVIGGLFACVLFGKATFVDIIPFLTLITGVILGNGELAVRKRAPSAIITPPINGDEVVTIHGSYPVERENAHE